MQRKPSINHEGEKMEELNKKLNEKARKQHLPFLLLGIVLLIIAAVIIGPAASKTLNARNLAECTELQLITGDTYELKDFNKVIGSYATDQSGQYFVIYREIDGRFMGLYLKGSDKTKAELIVDDNQKYLNYEADDFSSQSISVKGKLTSMTEEEMRYFEEWFTDSGWTMNEVYDSVYFYTLNTDEDDLSTIVIGAVLGVIGLALLVYALKELVGGGYKKKALEQISDRGLSADRVSAELSTAQSFKGADLARTFLMINSGNPAVIPYDAIVWLYGYQHTTVHKLYGIIPMGKNVTYSVKLVDRNRKEYTITCKNKEESNKILELISTMTPYAIKGYSDEMKATADRDFQSMIAFVDQNRATGSN